MRTSGPSCTAIGVAIHRALHQTLDAPPIFSDTFALRSQDPSLTVFEVDHPNTQAWKRARIAEEGLSLPPNLRFAAVDFAKDDLKEELLRAGLRPDEPAFFSWLGVVHYLEAPGRSGRRSARSRRWRAAGAGSRWTSSLLRGGHSSCSGRYCGGAASAWRGWESRFARPCVRPTWSDGCARPGSPR